MKTIPLFLQTIGFFVALLCAGHNLSAQSPSPSRPPSCPLGFGWAEGLVQYTAYPAPPFPTQDTANNPTTDCAFHQWSWEAFVWATAIDSNGQPRFLGLGNLDDIGKPPTAKKGPKPLLLKPRSLKPRGTQQDIQGDEQAGSNGLLVDQNGQVVWYSAHANPLYYNLVQKYYGAQAFAKASPTLQFPVGAAVFKAAWQIVPDGTKPTTVFTMPAVVPLLVANPKGGVMIDPSGKTRPVTVALVGLHVVGVTVNHPEFLWGSFEQVQNAPDLADPNGYNSPTPVSNTGFTFYQANTPANACNQMATETLTDPVKQTLSPITNVFRQYATGGENAAGNQEIAAINTGAQGEMASMGKLKPPQPAETVWANYKLIGTVWIGGNTLQPGDCGLNGQAIGSLNLADATLETFVQGPQNLGTNANCFVCHNTGGFSNYGIAGKDINLSHKILEPLFNNTALKRVAPGKPATK